MLGEEGIVEPGASWRVSFELVPGKLQLVPRKGSEGDREGREPEHAQATNEAGVDPRGDRRGRKRGPAAAGERMTELAEMRQ